MKKGVFSILAVLTVLAMVLTGCSDNSNQGTDPGPDDFYTVTFDKNTTDEGSTAPSPATRTVTPPATTTTLPNIDPTREGYIFNGYNTKANGTGVAFTNQTQVTANMKVYAQWKAGYKVTFNKNTTSSTATDPDPAFVDIEIESPGVSVTLTDAKMPADLTWEGFEFKGWNLLSEPEEGKENDTKFDGNTPITSSVTVYAQWNFIGGTPKEVNGTIVVNMPMFVPYAGNKNAKLNKKTGVYNGSDSNFDYKFPTDVNGQDANNYDYFVMLTQITNGQSGNITGIRLNQYRIAIAYGGTGTNKQPWLSNPDGQRILQEVSGAGTTGGIRIYADDRNVAEFRIISITFYKSPRYTVTFNYGGYAGAPDNLVVSDVIGKNDDWNGLGVGTARWPENPDRTTEFPQYFFMGWKDEDGYSIIASTPISKDITLTARWTDVVPTGWVDLVVLGGTQAPVYAFQVPEGEKLGDYIKLSVKLKAADMAYGSGATARFRTFGPYDATGWNANGLEGDSVSGTAADPNRSSKTMGNAVDGLLLTTTSAAGAGVNSITLPKDNTWYEFTLDLKAGRDEKYNTVVSQGGDGTGVGLFDDATGIQLLGITCIPPGGNNDPRSFYIKDIKISTEDGSKSIEALDPKDPRLFGGTGAGIYVHAGGTGVTTRTRMYYEEG